MLYGSFHEEGAEEQGPRGLARRVRRRVSTSTGSLATRRLSRGSCGAARMMGSPYTPPMSSGSVRPTPAAPRSAPSTATAASEPCRGLPCLPEVM